MITTSTRQMRRKAIERPIDHSMPLRTAENRREEMPKEIVMLKIPRGGFFLVVFGVDPLGPSEDKMQKKRNQ
jgi:hypothetical protein